MGQKAAKDGKPHYVVEGRARSFGRVATRMSPEKQEALEARLQPFIFDPAQLNPAACNVLEIGMGNGLLLLHRAENDAERCYYGVEVYKNGLRTLVNACEKGHVPHLKISNQDARDVLLALPDESLDQLCLHYPDPWPKRKQFKRRIVNDFFLDQAWRALKPGGELFMVTDIPSYAIWMVGHVQRHNPWLMPAVKPEDWAQAPDWWQATKYEQKAAREGRFPWYFSFLKPQLEGEEQA